jgi:hypothetical protein
MWRQGDVFIAAVKDVPRGATRRPGTVLVEGELTGHSHRLANPAEGELVEKDSILYLIVKTDWARIIHQEHKEIRLPRGTYRVWGQREYTPEAIVRVVD